MRSLLDDILFNRLQTRLGDTLAVGATQRRSICAAMMAIAF
jgi:hypothetical protein